MLILPRAAGDLPILPSNEGKKKALSLLWKVNIPLGRKRVLYFPRMIPGKKYIIKFSIFIIILVRKQMTFDLEGDTISSFQGRFSVPFAQRTRPWGHMKYSQSVISQNRSRIGQKKWESIFRWKRTFESKYPVIQDWDVSIQFIFYWFIQFIFYWFTQFRLRMEGKERQVGHLGIRRVRESMLVLMILFWPSGFRCLRLSDLKNTEGRLLVVRHSGIIT